MILSVGIGNGSRAGARITLDGLAPALKIHADYGVSEEIAAKRPEVLIFGRWVLDSDDDWRPWEANGNPIGFYQHYFLSHVLANKKIRYWSTGLNEDNRKLFDNDEYKRLAGDSAARAAWLEVHYYAFVPGIDRTRFPTSESPDFGDYIRKANFEIPIMRAIVADGGLPTCLASAVGNPSGSPEEQRGVWRAYHTAIVEAHHLGGMIDLHAYGNVAGWDGPVQTLIDHMRATGVAVPIIFGECGSEPGYRRRMRDGDPAHEPGFDSGKYLAELIGYDNHIRQRWPGLVPAAFIFCANLAGWDDYSIEGDETVTNGLVSHGRATYQRLEARALGLDVSAWQDDNTTPRMMDWAKAKAAGASFAFIRASAGLTPDPDWEYNVIGATQAGLLCGAYHYMTYQQDALEQARLFWSQVKSNGLALPLVADIEEEPFPTWGAAHVRAFIDEIERLSGKRVAIYTRASYWNYTLFGQGLESGRKLWVASYRNDAPLIPRGWSAWEFWQYTNAGNGPQYGAESAAIDLNRFNGTEAELRARYPVTAPTPPPQPARIVFRDGFESGLDDWTLFHVRSNAEGKHPTANIERKSTHAHPDSVRSGDASARVIGKWICWKSGLRRTVTLMGLTPGQTCRASAWVRLWASERDDFPAEPNPEIIARAVLRVILPDGSITAQTVSGFGWRELRAEWKATAASETIVINLDADLGGIENRWPVLNTVAFWDDVVIETVAVPPPVPPPPPPSDYFPAWTHRVIVAELPVRVTPWRTGNAPRVVFTLGKGSRVEILQRDSDWGRIGLGQWIRLREGTNTEVNKQES